MLCALKPMGGATTVEQALARWVLAQAAPAAERPALLAAIPRPHVWLGLLEAQIEHDLALLSVGLAEAAERERRSAWARTKPDARPYFGLFTLSDVLWALPVAKH